MTFSSYNKNTALIPKLNDDKMQQVTEIENSFIEFNKCFTLLKEYSRKLLTYTNKEYYKNKDDMHYKIQLLPDILIQINRKTQEIMNNENLETNIIEKLEKIKEKITPQVEELPSLMTIIYEREKIVSLKVNNINISE